MLVYSLWFGQWLLRKSFLCDLGEVILSIWLSGSANYSENGGYRFNATVTVKTDYEQLMSTDGALAIHMRLLHAMVTAMLILLLLQLLRPQHLIGTVLSRPLVCHQYHVILLIRNLKWFIQYHFLKIGTFGKIPKNRMLTVLNPNITEYSTKIRYLTWASILNFI